jgi:hypothetical protein
MTLTEVLLDFDGPALSLVQDGNGNKYLAYQATSSFEPGSLIALPISEVRLKGVVDGVADIRSAVIASSLYPNFMLLTPTSATPAEHWTARLFESSLSANELPGHGLRLDPDVATHSLASLVASRATTIAKLSLFPPEAEQRHVVSVDTLADILKALQRLLRRALPHVARKIDSATSANLRTVSACSMDVFAFGQGSFEVLLEPRAGPDLLARSDAATLLTEVSDLFDTSSSIENTIAHLRLVKGHYASAYVRFLELLVEHRAPLAFAWMDSSSPVPRSARIDVEQARDLLVAIKKSSELEIQGFIATGVLEQADVPKGRWRLLDSDGVQFTGETESVTLEGLTLGSRYRFQGKEVVQEEAGTGKETVRLVLTETPVAL